MDRRPPLVLSPRRLRPRRSPPGSYAPSAHAPPASKKPPPSTRSSVSVESPARPDHQLISSDLAALAERVKEELGRCGGDAVAAAASPGAGDKSPLFERGRFYDLYSARRNERLKRKMLDICEEAVGQDPGVAVELAKRRASKKAAEGVRKSMPAGFSAGRASSLRSSVRSSKEMKKACSAAAAAVAECSAVGGRRISTRSVRRL